MIYALAQNTDLFNEAQGRIPANAVYHSPEEICMRLTIELNNKVKTGRFHREFTGFWRTEVTRFVSRNSRRRHAQTIA
jgi:hypothetical protein